MDLKEEKVLEIRKELDSILLKVEDHVTGNMALHKVEKDILKSVLALGLHLLKYYISLVHSHICQEVPKDRRGVKMKNTGRRARPYISIFGRLTIERNKYYSSSDKKTYYTLDHRLGLPRGHYSYQLSDWLGFNAVELDFQQGVNQLERILGLKLHGMQGSRQTYELSTEVENFYDRKSWENQDEGTHLSAGFDGKGVPIIRSQADRGQESVSARLGKGQKKGVKKEATVSVSSSFFAKSRTKEQVLDSLFAASPTAARPAGVENKKQGTDKWHKNKHVRAFLSDKQKAIEYGFDNLLKRDKSGKKHIIVLIDGDRPLEKSVNETVQNKGIADRVKAYVLDFIHLLEYVWKVANAYLGEKNRERESWVKQQAELLLESKSGQVLEKWQGLLENNRLSKNQRYNIERAISYVGNRPHMIDYKTYLQNGYPITTGVVESACGHFVKSRMEKNAMHWGKQGAQKMLDARAIKKNEDWDQYMQYFIDKKQHELYGHAA